MRASAASGGRSPSEARLAPSRSCRGYHRFRCNSSGGSRIHSRREQHRAVLRPELKGGGERSGVGFGDGLPGLHGVAPSRRATAVPAKSSASSLTCAVMRRPQTPQLAYRRRRDRRGYTGPQAMRAARASRHRLRDPDSGPTEWTEHSTWQYDRALSARHDAAVARSSTGETRPLGRGARHVTAAVDVTSTAYGEVTMVKSRMVRLRRAGIMKKRIASQLTPREDRAPHVAAAEDCGLVPGPSRPSTRAAGQDRCAAVARDDRTVTAGCGEAERDATEELLAAGVRILKVRYRRTAGGDVHTRRHLALRRAREAMARRYTPTWSWC